MVNSLAGLTDDERELIIERVNGAIAVAQAPGTRFGRTPMNPEVIAGKLKIVTGERAKGRRHRRRPLR